MSKMSDVVMHETNSLEEDNDLNNPIVVTKYTSAAEIVQDVARWIEVNLLDGKVIGEICAEADKMIETMASKIFVKGKLEKGIAFPTCISVNNLVGHYSPLLDDKTFLRKDDVVKVDVGVHIDGYIAQNAFTAIVSPSTREAITGRQADVICAAYLASEAALRLLKPGNKNTDVTMAINKIASTFQCQAMEGVLSHQVKRFIIDGEKVIMNRLDNDNKVEEFTFVEGEVYSLDVVMSTGEGKAKESEVKTTVFKRNVDVNYNLKMKASRLVYAEISNRFSVFPFSLRALEDKKGRLGIVECMNHGLVQPFPVLLEKPGEYVAQFKFTAMLTPTGTLKLTDAEAPHVRSEKQVQDVDLNNLLALPIKKSKVTQKKKMIISQENTMDMS